MRDFTSGRYKGESDLQSMIDLLPAVRPPDRITDYPAIVDLRAALGQASIRENTGLWWKATGQLVAFAFVDTFSNLHFECASHRSRGEIESQIVAWGVECVRCATRPGDPSATLDTTCREDDFERSALLERHGFLVQEMRTLELTRPLDESIPAPTLPAGFCIRPVAGAHEAEALVALHRAAFGTQHLTVEARLAWMLVPEYDPQLDLVAVAPDDRLAAYCMCSISPADYVRSGRREGYTDPVATHPDFRRLGLARALLLTGLHLLAERGIETAALGTTSENVPMQQAAKGVGFRVRSTKLWFSKSVAEM